MLQTPKVNFTDQDNSFNARTVVVDINGLRGITERGPIDDPSIILSSPNDYRRIYGNELSTSEFPALCLRYLEKGGKLRVSRVAHYTDVTDATTLTALAPGAVAIKDVTTVAQTLFTITPKYKGVRYNDLKVAFSAASNGLASHFNMSIYILGDEGTTRETYENITIPGRPTVLESTYLNAAILGSSLVNFTYNNLSQVAAGAVLKPASGVIAFVGGSNGDAVLPVDYIGSSVSEVGFYSFNKYDDILAIATPEVSNSDINQGGAIYANSRQDLFFIAHLANDLKTPAALIAQRALVTVDTKYIIFTAGGVKIKDPLTLQNKDISEVIDIMYLMVKNNRDNAPWISFANYKRGTVLDAIGVATNFGSTGDTPKLDLLAQRQINTMIARNGRVYFVGNLTGQLTESAASYINVTLMLIYLKKALRPIFEGYLQDPLDIELFRAIYREGEPILEDILNRRGLYDYVWDGDQDISSIEDVKVNSLQNINQGIYKVKIGLEPIRGLVLADIYISLNNAGELTITEEPLV